MIKYSIILRAYNAENSIKNSIESIIGQSYKNWELIIVNDGSTDQTGEISEQYAMQEKRIKVVHQENKGCLLATQTGVRESSGDYVCLIDSDDCYEYNYIEQVDHIIGKHKVDMVVANYNIIDSEGKKYFFKLCEQDKIVNANVAMKEFFKTTNYALWNKFIARKNIVYTASEQNYFDKNGHKTNFGDDLYLLMPALCNCKTIYFTSEYLYNYVIDSGSISHRKNKNYWDEIQKKIKLMEFSYYAIKQRNYMDDELEYLIKLDTIEVLIDDVVSVVKTLDYNRSIIKMIKDNHFYMDIVKETDFQTIRKKLGTKRAMAFKIFNILM